MPSITPALEGGSDRIPVPVRWRGRHVAVGVDVAKKVLLGIGADGILAALFNALAASAGDFCVPRRIAGCVPEKEV
jgi:hypothetical protein